MLKKYKEDDKECDRIIGSVVSYFLRIKFDELSIGVNGCKNGISEVTDRARSEYEAWINAGALINAEAGTFNKTILESLK